MSKEQKKFDYPGKDISVTWDGRLCIHIAECGKAKGDLFVGGRKPWCQPDLVNTEYVVDVVKRCPTGALTFQSHTAEPAEKPAPANTITVAYNGPYFVRGDIEFEGAPDDMEGIKYRTALCRCGKSKIKPFCDNTHESENFQDYGSVGETGEASSEKGGKLRITPMANGPLLVNGNLTIINSSGQVAWTGKSVALCRCGESENKPFCDGSHVKAGFNSTE